MTTPTYPPLDEGTLRLIAMYMEQDSDYLKNPACPYNRKTIEMFVAPTSTETSSNVNDIERQKKILKKLREQLDEQGRRLDEDSLETSAANAYFRQRLTVEKEILELEKQIHFIENVDGFYATVLQIMEDVLNADQRDEVMTRLRAMKEKEGT